jgi:hypothetical protein
MCIRNVHRKDKKIQKFTKFTLQKIEFSNMSAELDDDVESSYTRIKQFLESSIPTTLKNSGNLSNFVSARDLILQQVTDAYNSPLTDALSIILKRNVGEAKGRELLFAPVFTEETLDNDTRDGMALYPIFISGPSGGVNAPSSHPAKRVQAISMFLLYISHLRHWERARAFVLAGGLQALVTLFNCENIALKSQAIDAFQQISGHPDFDWFAGRGDNIDISKEGEEPPLQLDSRDAKLHTMMLSLGRSPSLLISSLLSNFDSPNWPGGSYSSLQVLAFWLSWARRLHCGGGPLSLSSKVIETLKLWAEREAKPEIERDGEEDNLSVLPNKQRYSEREERTLAKQLFDDFSRFPAPIEDVQRSLIASSVSSDSYIPSTQKETSLSGISLTAINSNESSSSVSASTSTATSSLSSLSYKQSIQEKILSHKDIGNMRFRESNWTEALSEYTIALALFEEEIISTNDTIKWGLNEQNALKTTLYSNRAAAHLRASGYGGDLSPSPLYFSTITSSLQAPEQRSLRIRILAGDQTVSTKNVKDEQEMIKNAPNAVRCLLFCISDASFALSIDPTHGKSLLRKAQALTALGQFDAATAVARACIVASSSGEKNTSSELRANASSFLTFIMALQNQIEDEEFENETVYKDNDSIDSRRDISSSVLLDALLSRAEFGGQVQQKHNININASDDNNVTLQPLSSFQAEVANETTMSVIPPVKETSHPLASLNDVLAGISKSNSGIDSSKKSSIPLHLRALMK